MDANESKDRIAMAELEVVIGRLRLLLEAGLANIGRSRPIISAQEIELAKDHLDLVTKYSRL